MGKFLWNHSKLLLLMNELDSYKSTCSKYEHKYSRNRLYINLDFTLVDRYEIHNEVACYENI